MANPPQHHQQWNHPPYPPSTMTYHPPYQWPPLPPTSSAPPNPYPNSRHPSTSQPIIHPPPMQSLDTESNPCHSPLLAYEEGEEELDELGPLPSVQGNKSRRPSAQHSIPQTNRSKGSSRSRSISDAGVPSTTTGRTGEESAITTAIFLPDPSHPPIYLRGVNRHGLLPAPLGAILDVNDLLMLHPPDKVDTIAGHSSQFEMYTCRVCSKTYDGKNARSVARRHLQDKHGVPLSVQKRRSRWDLEPDRPKSQQDVNERNLKSKRNWAVKNRQQGKLEKAHSAFLERFGPNGVVTACGARLIAPRFRGGGALDIKGQFLDGEYGKVIIPEDILRGVQMIRERDGERVIDVDSCPEEKPAPEPQPKAKGKGRKKAATVSEGSRALRPAVSVNIPPAPLPTNSVHSSPSSSSSTGPDYYQASITQTPVSTARTYIQETAYPFQQAYYFPPTLMSMQNNGYHYMFPAQAQMPIDPAIQKEDSPIPIDVEPPLTARTDRSHASPPHMLMPLQQQWVSSDTWSNMEQRSQMDAQAQLEPAHEIEPQWQRMHLGDWDSSDGSGGRDDIKEGSVETEGEAMAAESLLNLHSTPIRGPGETPTSRLSVTVVNDNSDEAIETTAFGPVNRPAHWDGGVPSDLLGARTMTSPVPVRPIRSRSFIQPFRDPRPEITRSLSFDNSNGLDDPFVLEPTPARPLSNPTQAHSSSMRRSKRHTISAPSPSPLSTTQRKRKEVPSSPMGAPPAPRSVLKTISNNTASTNMNRRGSAVGFGAFQTPLKGGGAGVHFQNPTSMTKFGGGGWLFSSPGTGDAAASLGLVPTHLAPSTPGLRGIVGADTPEMSILEARAKKMRRSEI